MLGKRLVTKMRNIASVLERQIYNSLYLKVKTIIHLLYIGYFANL